MKKFRFPIRMLFHALFVSSLLCAATFAQNPASENSQIPTGPYRIAGVVVNAKTNNPLAHSRVTIGDTKSRQSTQSVITADDGRFEFRVPAGKFSLTGAKRGYITASYNQHDQFSTAIVTGADVDAEHLVLKLAPNAVLTGKVLDEFGEPVRNAQIMVYRENHFQGVSRVTRFRGAMTDDQGKYEVTPLDEGTYFVSVKAQPWYAIHPTSNRGSGEEPSQIDQSLDVAYPITYYGDATEPEDAAAIPVRGGDRLEADIHLSPSPALHVVVHIPEDGDHAVAFPMLQKPAFDGMEPVQTGGMQQISPGQFEMTGVAAGRYSIRMPDSTGALKEPVEVNLAGGGDLDVSAGNPTSKIKFTIQMESGGAHPTQLQLALRNSKGRIVSGGEVDSKGEANFQDIVPGKYDVLAGSLSDVFSVVRISSAAETINGRTLNVPPGASLDVSITLVGGSVRVEGFAKRNGKGSDGAMIVLVPKNPEANHDRFRRDQSDLDGSFVLPNVVPGIYTIIAIENGWDLDWAKPAVLASYLKRGQTLEIKDHSAATIRIPTTVEVQGR
jgi:carboxypeptidase family protein